MSDHGQGGRNWTGSMLAAGLTAGVSLAGGSLTSQAQGQVDEPVFENKVSATVGLAWNSHFMLFGEDVWQGGTGWGNNMFNPSMEVAVELPHFTLSIGAWADVSDNDNAAIGGNLQEVDWWLGASRDFGDFSVSVGYQSWITGGTTEEVASISVGYDDSAYLGDFALNPSVLYHYSFARDTFILELGVEPGLTLIDSQDFPLAVSFPIAVGFAGSDYYGGDSGSGYAYFSAGAQFSMPLTFIPAGYGDWSLDFGLTYYSLAPKTQPKDSSLIAGNIGLTLSF